MSWTVMTDFSGILKKNEGLGMDAAQKFVASAVEVQEKALEYEHLVGVRFGCSPVATGALYVPSDC